MQERMERRVCKRCLLKEADEQAYYEKLDKLLKLMDEDIKAGTELYEKRLAACKECEKLSEGTCLACGCYVELRAAVGKNKCPYKYW